MCKRGGKSFIQNNDYVKDIRVPGTYKEVVTTHVDVYTGKLLKLRPIQMFR